MIADPSCAVCGGTDLLPLGSHLFRRRDAARVLEYVARRYRVLFEAWLNGAEEARFHFMMCSRCGFVFQAPRPTEADLDAKYRFLVSLPSEVETSGVESNRADERARRLFSRLPRRLRKHRGARVLDFGGGNGRLMRPFVEAGLAIDLVDFASTAEDGVRRIGDTEASLPAEAVYDAIICSHVVEHVADPVGIVKRLIACLKPHGVIYVEVPMEIFGGPPRQEEPVTHINFFTPGSLRHLLQRAHSEVISCRLSGHPHPSGRDQLVISALARCCDRRAVQVNGQRIDTPRSLVTSAPMKAYRRLLLPSTIPAAIRHKLGFEAEHGRD